MCVCVCVCMCIHIYIYAYTMQYLGEQRRVNPLTPCLCLLRSFSRSSGSVAFRTSNFELKSYLALQRVKG